MTLTIDLQPDIERGLLAGAEAKGVSLVEFAQEVLARAVLPVEQPVEPKQIRTGRELIEAAAEIRGLLTDEEIDQMFSRTPSYSRPVDFS